MFQSNSDIILCFLIRLMFSFRGFLFDVTSLSQFYFLLTEFESKRIFINMYDYYL